MMTRAPNAMLLNHMMMLARKQHAVLCHSAQAYDHDGQPNVH